MCITAKWVRVSKEWSTKFPSVLCVIRVPLVNPAVNYMKNNAHFLLGKSCPVFMKCTRSDKAHNYLTMNDCLFQSCKTISISNFTASILMTVGMFDLCSGPSVCRQSGFS